MKQGQIHTANDGTKFQAVIAPIMDCCDGCHFFIGMPYTNECAGDLCEDVSLIFVPVDPELQPKAPPRSAEESSFWNDDKVIDFVNWYMRLHKLDFRYTLENKTIIETYKNGDDVAKWHCPDQFQP